MYIVQIPLPGSNPDCVFIRTQRWIVLVSFSVCSCKPSKSVWQKTLCMTVCICMHCLIGYFKVCTTMSWHCIFIFQRGKFRPRLTELVKGNTPKTVEDITRTGISLLPKLGAAIQHVMILNGVGPATASGKLIFIDTLLTCNLWGKYHDVLFTPPWQPFYVQLPQTEYPLWQTSLSCPSQV